MKYSQEQVSHHQEVIYDLVCRNPSLSTRELCQELSEKHNLKLNRAYATKLMWQACRRLTEARKAATERRAEFAEWQQQLAELVKEIDELKFRLKEIIDTYPGDWADPTNRERYW